MSSTCAVVPTYNRREMLDRCVAALRAQQRPLAMILVIDNGSTQEVGPFPADGVPVTVVRNERNTGSAGGFGSGIRWVVEHGYDWIWLIDNDSFARPDAHGALLDAVERFPEHARPSLLCSRVEWTDGTVLPLSAPMFRRRDLDTFYDAAAAATISIRMAPYAGTLLHRSLPVEHGLPIERYFLWNDDVEYTGRLLRHDFGVLVPQSVLTHEVARRSTTTADAGARFYFEIRNKLWMLRGSNAYSSSEKVRFLVTLAVDTGRFLTRSRPLVSVKVVLPALARGLFAPAPRPGPPLREPPRAGRTA